MLLVYSARSVTILCQKIPESESHELWRCTCVTILVYSIAPVFSLLRWIPKRLGIIALNSILCNGKLFMFGSSDSVKSFSEEFQQSDKIAFLLV